MHAHMIWPSRICVQIACNALGFCHMQHVVLRMEQRDSLATGFDRVFSFILLPEINNKWRRGGNPELLVNTPDDKLQKMPHSKAQQFKPWQTL